jgi:hypothetical protein
MNEKLKSFIETRDRRIVQKSPWMTGPLSEAFGELLKDGSVRMGGRATCGSSVDPTWAMFCAWNEVVRKARTLGYRIAEENVKHGNGWATKAGGFWNERLYTLETQS